MSAGQPVALPVLQPTLETAPEPEQQVKLSVWSQSSSSGKKADSEQETEQTMELSARPADIGGYLGPPEWQPVAPPADVQSSSSVSAGQPVALPVNVGVVRSRDLAMISLYRLVWHLYDDGCPTASAGSSSDDEGPDPPDVTYDTVLAITARPLVGAVALACVGYFSLPSLVWG